MKEKSPAFQFYPKDLLSDPVAMSFENETLGAYLKLLCFDWMDDGIPDDDQMLCRLAGITSKDPQKTMEPIRLKYIKHPTKQNHITNKRLQKERERQATNREQKSNAGRASAQRRANGKATEHPTEGATESNPPSPTPSSTPSPSSSSSSPPTSKKTKPLLSGKPDPTEIIEYLNLKCSRNFKPTPKHRKQINARIKEGYTLEDFKRVVDNMVKRWGDDGEMMEFLRPITLFGTKMDSYLNTNGDIKSAKSTFEKKRDVVDEFQREMEGQGGAIDIY